MSVNRLGYKHFQKHTPALFPRLCISGATGQNKSYSTQWLGSIWIPGSAQHFNSKTNYPKAPHFKPVLLNEPHRRAKQTKTCLVHAVHSPKIG